MKTRFGGVCVLLLGATLAVGCGGAELDGPEDSQGPVTVEKDNPSEVNPAADAEITSRDQDEERAVGASGACCYAACTGDNRPGYFYGPFRTVKYGNCANYGEYFCGQHHWTLEKAKWDDC
ncbi:hypothetical protein [Corallococcus carmarthensis]|uniref:hypothetical protein n=1 Tax=Corallococcus carmarthensis TaxID=2316728 RepID=UPI00148CAC2C|nr:hypothetical protein [Corallococcus carmarthensis]NOK20552.1 hypothetical protein [Corallococcus carmarthensis]